MHNKSFNFLLALVASATLSTPVFADGIPEKASKVSSSKSPFDYWLAGKGRVGYDRSNFELRTGTLNNAVGQTATMFNPGEERKVDSLAHSFGLGLNRSIPALSKYGITLGADLIVDPTSKTARYSKRSYNAALGEDRHMDVTIKRSHSIGGRVILGIKTGQNGLVRLGYGVDWEKIRMSLRRATENHASTLMQIRRHHLVHQVVSLGYQHSMGAYILGAEVEVAAKASQKFIQHFPSSVAGETENMHVIFKSGGWSALATITVPFIK